MVAHGDRHEQQAWGQCAEPVEVLQVERAEEQARDQRPGDVNVNRAPATTERLAGTRRSISGDRRVRCRTAKPT
jgi:hypothetical protein